LQALREDFDVTVPVSEMFYRLARDVQKNEAEAGCDNQRAGSHAFRFAETPRARQL
jgi:hypothetical protein